MTFVQLQLAAWDKILSLPYEGDDLSPYDLVVLKSEQGLDLARVLETSAAATGEAAEDMTIVRKATAADEAATTNEAEKKRILADCHQFIKKLNLEMKLVDVRFSLDGGRLTFAFVANGRVDFRDLVKELTKHFNKNIRLQQIGIRDEARAVGDQGRCGRALCCRGHLGKFSSVTGEMAEAQNLANRGSDRLSGACGRLMCCLAYEFEGYKELNSELPPVGTRVNADGKRGVVVGHHPLKRSVDVKFSGSAGENDYTVEIDLERQKK